MFRISPTIDEDTAPASMVPLANVWGINEKPLL